MAKNKYVIESYQGSSMVASVCFAALVSLFLVGYDIKHDVWLSLTPMILGGTVLAFIFSWVLKNFKGEDLLQLNDKAFGKIGGKIVNWILLFLFLGISVFEILTAIYMFSSLDMWSTPIIVYIIFVMIAVFYCASLGLEVIARMSTIFVLIIILAVIFDTLVLLPSFHLDRILPIAEYGWKGVGITGGKFFILQYAMLPAVLLFLPNLRNRADAPRALRIGLMIAGFYFTIAVLRDSMIFGDLVQNEVFPTLQAMRRVQLGTDLSRVELGGLLAVLANKFIFSCIGLYSISMLCGCYHDSKKQKKSLAFFAVIIAVGVYTLSHFAAGANDQMVVKYVLIAGMLILAIFLLTVILLALRRGLQKNKQNNIF